MTRVYADRIGNIPSLRMWRGDRVRYHSGCHFLPRLFSNIRNNWTFLARYIVPALMWFLLIASTTTGSALRDSTWRTMNDTSMIEVRQPPFQKIHRFSKDKDFQYQATAQNPKSFWAYLFDWVLGLIEKLMQHKASRIILKLVLYLGFATIIFLLVNQFFHGNIMGLLQKEKRNPLNVNVTKESATAQDPDRLIQEAIEHQQYNTALLLLYKKCLDELHANGWIKWRKDKTNHDYVYELTSGELRQLFRSLTHYYEYARYGDFILNSDNFEKAHQQFKRMEAIIRTSP